MSMKSIAVIPARYASTRFPGKLLMNLGGKTIIQHVWERTKRSKADDVLIAVDDQRVFDAARAFGAEVVMTSPDHPSGSACFFRHNRSGYGSNHQCAGRRTVCQAAGH